MVCVDANLGLDFLFGAPMVHLVVPMASQIVACFAQN